MLGILNIQNKWIKLLALRSCRRTAEEIAAGTKRTGRFKKKAFEPGW
jgi:hypothetical protein